MCRSRRGFLAVLLLTTLLAACGGDGAIGSGSTSDPGAGAPSDPQTTTTVGVASTTSAPAGPTGSAPDPCALLSVDDIETATGLPFGEGVFNESLSSGFQVICDWIGTEEFATVQTLIVPMEVWDTQKATAAEVFNLVDVEIDGADAAYATEEGSVVGMRAHGMFLQVSYIPPGPGNVLEITSALAAVAVSNLRP